MTVQELMGRAVRLTDCPDGRPTPKIFRSECQVQIGLLIGGYRYIVTAKLTPFSQYIRGEPIGAGYQTAEHSIAILVVIIHPVLVSHAGILKIGLIVAQHRPRFVLLPCAATGDGSPHGSASIRRDITVLQQSCFVVIQAVDRTGSIQ